MTGRHEHALEQARQAAVQSLTETRRDVAARVECQASAPEHLRVRTQLMTSLRRFIETCGMIQCEAADFFDIAQPEISHLVNLKVHKFSVDRLINLHARAGLTIYLNAQIERSSP